MDPLFYIVGGVIVVSVVWKYFSSRKPRVFEEVEREAELQLISHDTIAMKNFCRAKGDYMLPETFKKLIARIQELETDKEYLDSLVKSKIDAL